MKTITDFFRRTVVKALHWWSRRKLVKCLQGEVLDEFLEALLEAMRLGFRLAPHYRKNIDGFRGRYVFRSQDGAIAVSVLFENGEMIVRDEAVADTDVTVTFKDGAALFGLLLSKDPDIFALVLDNKLSYEGNLNYILRFGFMAKRLQHDLRLGAPA